ncbi:site-specific integrase [Bacillus thuringiensis]|uniref:tyrosine-type recombinase/integrase n=1 Tax=Bacillus thuringiensis TaxID=1428 RepID=UPI0022256604|nr:site-specific integrase [Bacillus thuringiensis]UYX52397.1 site-specific integrase [Bacillus thuringiensis]
MKQIVDQAIYEKHVSQENKNLVKDFLIEKKAQGKAASTLQQYNWDLRIILFLIHEHFENKNLIKLTRKEIRNLSIIFQEMKMSNARVNGLMSALRSALEFCTDDDDYNYEFNVGSRVRGLPKNPIREITFIAEDQINWLIDELIEQEKYMLSTYLALSYYSAARKNEIHQVQKEGLIEQYYTNVVRGKRGKKFRLYYNPRVQKCIRLYINQRGKDAIPDLFVRVYKNGGRKLLNKSVFNYWCKIFSKMLYEKEGKKFKINPHCFRHSRLDNLKVQGVPLEKLKSLANHSDISTTESYLKDRSEEDIAEIFGLDPSYFAA